MGLDKAGFRKTAPILTEERCSVGASVPDKTDFEFTPGLLPLALIFVFEITENLKGLLALKAVDMKILVQGEDPFHADRLT